MYIVYLSWWDVLIFQMNRDSPWKVCILRPTQMSRVSTDRDRLEEKEERGVPGNVNMPLIRNSGKFRKSNSLE